jgi:hypothetical protein
MITVLALICRLSVADEPEVCYERVVVRQDSMVTVMVACELSQAAIAKWKSESIYSGPEWYISRITCRSGDYQPKDTI